MDTLVAYYYANLMCALYGTYNSVYKLKIKTNIILMQMTARVHLPWQLNHLGDMYYQ